MAIVSLVALAAHAEAAPGPRFELDSPVGGARAWGDQLMPRVASSQAGALVTWISETSDAVELQAVRMPGQSTPIRLGSLGETFARPYDVAFAGPGFLIAHEEESGIVATLLGPDGLTLAALPRLIVPASEQGRVVDLACDAHATCALVWRAAGLQVTVLGWDTSPLAPVWLASGSHAAITTDENGFIVAYVADGALRTRRVSPSGAPLGSAVEIVPSGVSSGGSTPLLAHTDSGHALVWADESAGAVVPHIGWLDPGGTLAWSLPLASGWPGGLASNGSSALLLSNGANGLQPLRIHSDGTLENLGSEIAKARADSAGFDGTGWVAAWEDGDGYLDVASDVYGVRIPDPSSESPETLLLSSADNSQWDARTAVHPDAPLSFAAWNDNRNDDSDVFGVVLGADGCPTGPPMPILDGDYRQGVFGVAAATNGFFAIGWGPGPSSGKVPWRWLLARVDERGARVGSPVELDAFANSHWLEAWPNPRGGFTAGYGHYGPSGVAFVDPDGAVRIAPWQNLDTRRAGRLDGGNAFALVAMIDPAGDLNNLRVEIFSELTGQPTLPEISVDAWASDVQVLGDADGYLFVWQQADTAYAGRLGLDGQWSGRTELAYPRLRSPQRVGEELWWLDLPHYAAPSVARTTLEFEAIGLDPLPADLEPVAFVPSAGAPSLLSNVLADGPSKRLAGHRLDGSVCTPPPARRQPRTPPAGTAPSALEPAGGCACRAAGAPDAKIGIAWVLIALLAARRTSRGAPRPRSGRRGRAPRAAKRARRDVSDVKARGASSSDDFG